MSDIMFTILKFLLANTFFYYKLLCDNLHPSSQVHAISCFMALPNDCALIHSSILGALEKMTYLIGNPPKYLLTSTMDTMIPNQGTLEEEVVIFLNYNETILFILYVVVYASHLSGHFLFSWFPVQCLIFTQIYLLCTPKSRATLVSKCGTAHGAQRGGVPWVAWRRPWPLTYS